MGRRIDPSWWTQSAISGVTKAVVCVKPNGLDTMVRVFAHGAMGRRIDPSW